MKQRITPGAEIDILTPHEFHQMLKRPVRVTRIRAGESFPLDAAAVSGIQTIYKVPLGAEFEIRRVTFDCNDCNGANLATQSHSLIVPNNFCRYLRSGMFMEYAMPFSPVSSTCRIPGVQTWGDQQGPYLRNGEVFQVDLALINAPSAALAVVTVSVEGLLTENRPGA